MSCQCLIPSSSDSCRPRYFLSVILYFPSFSVNCHLILWVPEVIMCLKFGVSDCTRWDLCRSISQQSKMRSPVQQKYFFLWCLIKLLIIGINTSWEWCEVGKALVPVKPSSAGAASDSFANCRKWGRVSEERSLYDSLVSSSLSLCISHHQADTYGHSHTAGEYRRPTVSAVYYCVCNTLTKCPLSSCPGFGWNDWSKNTGLLEWE